MNLDFEMKSEFICKDTNLNIDIVYPKAKLAVCYLETYEEVYDVNAKK